MSAPIVSVRGLGKMYHLGKGRSHDTLRDQLAHGFRAFGRRLGSRREEKQDQILWALRDISFDVAQGEVLGIMGMNGAGKSTLLKVLSQITEPTEGEVRIRGRIASLLEVGTGFHPELTGRENIYLNGSILGMTKAEIRRKFDEIVDFAEVERFLDTPVKRYSSGMYVRLAFAVAAHLEPEILIVDEVLAVGDSAFQKKCLNRMSGVSKEGRTVFFVSHNIHALSSLCTSGAVLKAGRLVCLGSIEEAISSYTNLIHKGFGISFEPDPTKPSITAIRLDEERLRQGDIRVEIDFVSPVELDPPVGGIVISAISGSPIYCTNPKTHPADFVRKRVSSGTVSVEVLSPPIHSASYRISVWFGDWHAFYDQKLDVLTFDFENRDRVPSHPNLEISGYLSHPARWSIHQS